MLNPHVRIAIAVGITAFALALVSAGCKDPGQPACTICPPVAAGPNYRPNSTYAAPLYNLAQAYNTRDINSMKAYLGMIGETYQFRYYNLQSSTPTTAIYWNTAQEDTAARGFLTDAAIARVELDLPLADTAHAEASSFAGDPPDTKKITIHGISLAMQRGDVLYLASGSCDFFVAPVDNEYRIVRWDDNTLPPQSVPNTHGATSVNPATWGTIKSIFLH